MYSWCVLKIAVLLGSLCTAMAIFENFYDRRGDFEFVFHNKTNLLLTAHDGSCFFSYIAKPHKPYVDNPYYKNLVENELTRLIASQRTHSAWLQLSPSSLLQVLNEFQDLLANFRCSAQTIYELKLLNPFYDHIIQMVG